MAVHNNSYLGPQYLTLVMEHKKKLETKKGHVPVDAESPSKSCF